MPRMNEFTTCTSYFRWLGPSWLSLHWKVLIRNPKTFSGAHETIIQMQSSGKEICCVWLVQYFFYFNLKQEYINMRTYEDHLYINFDGNTISENSKSGSLMKQDIEEESTGEKDSN